MFAFIRRFAKSRFGSFILIPGLVEQPRSSGVGLLAGGAQRIDVTLAGPKVKAKGNVRSVLQPAKKGQKPADGKDETKVPSMLKQDQPVNVTAENLAKLKPFFDRKYGNVTAGKYNDGAPEKLSSWPADPCVPSPASATGRRRAPGGC
mgnify:CR=1 FL=1